MNANTYQKLANRTLIDRPDFEITDEQTMIAWNAIGLTGEAGEVADLVKKQIFHQLGDVLWYVAALCTEFGFTLEEVMQHNIEKLKARFPDGYSPDRTTFREGEAG